MVKDVALLNHHLGLAGVTIQDKLHVPWNPALNFLLPKEVVLLGRIQHLQESEEGSAQRIDDHPLEVKPGLAQVVTNQGWPVLEETLLALGIIIN